MRRLNIGFWKKDLSDPYVSPVIDDKKSLKKRLSPYFWLAGAGVALGFLVILPALSMAVIPAASASASDAAPPSAASIKTGKFTWWDRNTIHADINGKTYYFRANHSDSSLHYDIKNSACDGKISFDDANPFYLVAAASSLAPDEIAPKNINVDIDWADPGATGSASANCQDTNPNQLHHVAIGDPGNFDIYFQVSSDGRNLDTVGDDGNNFTQTGADVNDPSLFTRDSESGDSCQDVIQVNKANGTYKLYELDKNGDGATPPASIKAPASCKVTGHRGYVKMAVAQKLGNAGALVNTVNPNATAAGGNTDQNNTQLGCDYSSSPLSWIICPIVNLMVDAITAVDNLITDQMNINTQSIFCSDQDSCQAYYSAWVAFRNIALGLMVVAGMLIIIAQAIGMEILDAYTIRKTLPRLLIAAIGITLSWPIMNFAVTLSNDLGYGVRHLITAPFSQFNGTINLNFGHTDLTNVLGGGGAVAAGVAGGAVAWIALGGFGVLLSYLATAGLAVLIAILVLVIRQIAVIMLILVSPIAFIAYILPNTQKIFRFWWESFSKALLMFPLIAAFIAVGRVFAAISLKAGDPIHGFIGFIAYFAPYFLIPMTFRFAGGALSSIGGFVSERGQGAFGGLRNFRSGQRQQRVARARQTGLYRKDLGQFNYRLPGDKRRGIGPRTGGVGRTLNRAGFYSLNADEMIPMKLGGTRKQGGLNLPGFRRGAQVLHEQIDQKRREETSKALQRVNPGYKAGRLLGGLYQGSEHDYLGKLGTNDRAEFDREFGIRDRDGNITGYRAPDSYKSRMLAGSIIKRSGDQEAREAATEMQAAAAGLDAFNQNPNENYVDGQFLGLQAAAAEGRLGLDDIVKHHNTLHDAGHTTQAQHETATLQQLAAPKRTSMARGHGIEFDTEGKAINAYADPTSLKAQSATTRESAQDIGGSKAEDLHGLHGQAWVAKLADKQVGFDAKANNDDNKHAGGRVQLTGADKPVDSPEYQRAQEAQAEWRNMAMYASGDVGVGVELKRIWKEAGLPMEQLEFGSKRGEKYVPLAQPEQAAPPTPPEPPQPDPPA